MRWPYFRGIGLNEVAVFQFPTTLYSLRFFDRLFPSLQTRTHYLELLHRIVASTDYRDHLHRQRDLVACLNRIMNEEDSDGQADRELVKKLWMSYPQVFEEITDL
jgi:hypothetical protein